MNVRRFAIDAQTKDAAFAAALLSKVGRGVLELSHGDAYRRLVESARASGRRIADVERETLGVTHAEVGACLLDVWGLPSSIVDAVRFHHDPTAAPPATRLIAHAVHVADALANDATVDPSAFDGVGLAACVAQWIAGA
jgi:HD-like signal output (HDOD) protein